MRKNLKGLGGALAAVLLFAVSLPSKATDFRAETGILGIDEDLFKSCMVSVRKDCESWAAQGGGSEAPRGLSVDTKAELAQGEKYILSGYIETTATDIFLRINLHNHPWLASRTRVGNPFYRINDDVWVWKKYRGKEVTLIGTARYGILKGKEDGRIRLDISIDPAAAPMLESILRRH